VKAVPEPAAERLEPLEPPAALPELPELPEPPEPPVPLELPVTLEPLPAAEVAGLPAEAPERVLPEDVE
jgi:hypothetical protein